MQGFEVITCDDHKTGHVVEIRGEYLIIEHGALRKSRHAVPRDLAHVQDGEDTVRLTISKHVLNDSPKLNGEFDEQAVAEHYGLAPGSEQPPTEGYGDLLPDDPARSADQDRVREGLETAEEERARIRSDGGEEFEPPGLLGNRSPR